MRILLVDDEPDVRASAQLAWPLTDNGVEVRTTGDGEEALRLLRSGEHFDVILLDLMIPRLNGWQLLEEMNGAGCPEDVPVILYSDYTDTAVAVDPAAMTRVVGSVSKSDAPEFLLAEVARMVRQWRTKGVP